MNINELKSILESENIPKRYYLLGNEGVKEDRDCLTFSNGQWHVFYSERGQKHDRASFIAESDACNELLMRLRKRTKSL